MVHVMDKLCVGQKCCGELRCYSSLEPFHTLKTDRQLKGVTPGDLSDP